MTKITNCRLIQNMFTSERFQKCLKLVLLNFHTGISEANVKVHDIHRVKMLSFDYRILLL